jgi:electron transport complex protein RnfC
MRGGIQPPPNKRQSNTSPIAFAGIPDQLVLPLSQHLGAAARPCVVAGERVLKGQRIADAEGVFSVPLHAPTSGEVIAIEPRPIAHPTGLHAPCILLRPDGRDEWIEHRGIDDYTRAEPAQLLAHIRDAGIAGLGGAGFPTAAKLAVTRPIDTLIVNGAECEPYISADDMLMRERADRVVEGTKILRHLLQPSAATLIGIEADKPEAIAALTRAAAGSGIEVVTIPAVYPSGDEGQLIRILTGREVPSGGLPAEIGIVCQNVATAAAIHRAVCFGEPLITRITTVTGDACAAPRNYEVLLGTPLRHLLALGGFDETRCDRLIAGGPMMGFRVAGAEVPVTKTTHCVLAATAAELPAAPPERACIRCGLCAEACPVSLLPQQLYRFARGGEFAGLEAHQLFDCIECGACAYVCPSAIPLVHHYRTAKADILAQREDKKRAIHAKARFEAHNRRLEREAIEREERRRARLEMAKAKPAVTTSATTPAPVDVVRAAIERIKAKKATARGASDTARAPQLPIDAATDPQLQLAALRKRLANAEPKLQAARQQQSPKLPHFEENVAQLKTRIAALEAAVTSPRVTPAIADDPAQSAIARALAAHKTRTERSARQRTAQATADLEARLTKARDKLASAAQVGDDTSLLAEAVARLEQKLAAARAANAAHDTRA